MKLIVVVGKSMLLFDGRDTYLILEYINPPKIHL